MEVIKSREKPRQDTHRMIMRWFNKHYNLKHSAYGYIGMFGVWDMAGKNEIDLQVLLSGRTEHLIQMRDTLNKAIDEEIKRREEIDKSNMI